MNRTLTPLMLACLALVSGLPSHAQSRLDTPHAKAHAPGLTPNQRAIQPGSAKGGGYCAAGATGSVDFDLDERIVNATFANINNATANVAPTAPAYTLYTTPVGNVTTGMTYTLSVDVNTTTLTSGFSENQVLAWIDYNQDFDFDDAGEEVLVSAIGALDIYSGDVTIPMGATLGTTRMRIRLHDTHDGADYINVFNDTPCGDASYGEIEDYVLDITAGGGGAPSNDLCANAALIGVNATCVATTGTTENATQSVAPAACSGFTAASANDVWFTFTATTASTTIEVTGAGDATTGMDPVLEAFSGTCAALTSLGCVDATLRGATETLTIPTTPGTTYLYRIYYWPYVPQTVFGYTTCVISVGAGSAPANDLCANATTIGVNATCVATAGTTENGTQSLAPAACSGFTAASASDVWYTFTATAASTTIEVTGDGDATTGMDPVLEAFSGSCVALTSLGCVDATLRGGTETLTIATTAGTTYLYRIYYWPYVPQTVFGFTTCVIGSGGGPTPPNDDCTGAVAVSLSTPGSITLSGDNTGATVDPPTAFVVVWEAITITECSNITINYCQPGSEFEAFFINMAIQCPDFITGILAGGNDTCNVFFFDVAPGTYYIPVRVETDGSTPAGAYTIGVIAEPCGTVGPYCEAGASNMQFEKISNVTFADINNNSVSPAGYEDFTGVAATVVGGQTYPISVTIAGGFTTDQVLAWVDWNQDLDFDDAGEEVFVSVAGIGPHTGNITVPLTASLGPTRMRVRLHDTYVGANYPNTPNPTPCDTSTYGQVEDYTVDMIGIITGAEGLSEAAFGVYPNPTDGNVVVRTGSLNGSVLIEVMDALGRVAYAEQRTVAKASSVQLVLAGRLAAGTYVLRLSGSEVRKEQRIVIR